MSTGRYDAIVVGARCAGSPTAMLLARKGYRVLLRRQGDVPERHDVDALRPPAGRRRARALGAAGPPRGDRLPAGRDVLVRLRAAHDRRVAAAGRRDRARRTARAAPCSTSCWSTPPSRRAPSCARASPSTRSWSTTARVTGIRGHAKGGAPGHRARARSSIGADGRHSLRGQGGRARAVQRAARRSLAMYYAYWSGLPVEGFETTIRAEHGRGWAAIPTHDGLTVRARSAGRSRSSTATARTSRATSSRRSSSLPSSPSGCAARTRESKFIGSAELPGYFRKPFGPGWALVGDAGYHKNPITAMGINDAFRDAELVAGALDDAFCRTAARSTTRWATYQRTRDDEALPVYEFTDEFATARAAAARDAAADRGDARATRRRWTTSSASGRHAAGPGVLRSRERRADHGAGRHGGLTSATASPPHRSTLPSRRIVHGSIDATRRWLSLHGSRASVARTASSRLGLDGMHDAELVAERAAEDDEAVVHERVHEGRVRRPAGLLLQRPRRVPLRAGAIEHDEEHRHVRRRTRPAALGSRDERHRSPRHRHRRRLRVGPDVRPRARGRVLRRDARPAALGLPARAQLRRVRDRQP